MKKVPAFIFLLIFAVMLTACGAEDVEIQNTSIQRTEDVSPLPEENMPESEKGTEEVEEAVEDGSLRYFTIGIDSPVVEVDGDVASVTYTSVLNANAYGARGTYRMKGTHWFEKRNGDWISVNATE